MSLDSILKIENDSLLLSKILEYETNEIIKEIEPELEPHEDYREYQSIYDGEIIYSSDSILKIVNVHGGYSGGATYNPYSEYYLIKNKKVLNKGNGKILKMEPYSKNNYIISINNYSRMGDHINEYNLTLRENSIELKKIKRKNKIYDLIINKKESPKNFPDSIAYKFDFSKRFTEKEISILNLDTTKLGLNDYYFLTDEKFLKNKLDSISFIIYYKHMYGDELSKILRIKRKDSVFDLPLSISGGDVSSYKLSTEFINDSIFIKTYTHKQTAIENTHLMAYATDSIITKYHYDENLNFKEIKKDSFHIYKKYPTFYKNLKGKTFKTFSDIFSINGMKCHWEYEVKYTDETNKNSKEYFVNIISQKLMKFSPREYILDLDLSKFIYLPPKSIAELEYNKYPDSSIDNLKDVNSDNYTDIQFMTEHAGGGANIGYATYLFNSKNEKFEYSEVFSGYNIEYDAEKNRISSFGKGAVNDYYYTFKNLEPNRKDIEFTENIRHYGDTIFYRKMIDEKVVKEMKIVLGEYENWEKYLQRE